MKMETEQYFFLALQELSSQSYLEWLQGCINKKGELSFNGEVEKCSFLKILNFKYKNVYKDGRIRISWLKAKVNKQK